MPRGQKRAKKPDKTPEWAKPPFSFESTQEEGDSCATIYLSMMRSPAWQDLNNLQRSYYLACKSRYFSMEKKPYGLRDCFTLPRKVWLDEFRLGSSGGAWQQYTRAMSGLILHGFITFVDNGRHTRSKEAVYRFSDMWQYWGTRDFAVLLSQMPSWTQEMVKDQYWHPSEDMEKLFRPDGPYWDEVFEKLKQEKGP